MTNSNQHPIESLMKTAMSNIKEMVEVNTVVGDPIETAEGTVIMPITKATFGFAAGGAEYGTAMRDDGSSDEGSGHSERFPFGGGSGAGVCIQPVAFMVVEDGKVQIRHVNYHFGTMSKVMEEVPELIGKLGTYFNSKGKSKGKVKDESKENSEKNLTKVLEVYESEK
ncbi:GerW family sporulation protein [Defluviitalea raffinosedens]|uniref:GerW family sporulation protein n=1 Tax=Defluviitalea raffinosedens TaxID=1450156 RepID=UPI0019580485|nr:GerW family sporulation protein [Defluviitalea raffinosedens]MBM7686637.1 sporulation protein YtfJ [Defluviitalea raffinosedens]